MEKFGVDGVVNYTARPCHVNIANVEKEDWS